MKKQFITATAIVVSLFSVVTYAKTTYYCAPPQQISFTPQNKPWAAYAYSTPQHIIDHGIQPELMGEGFAHSAVKLSSVVSTDGVLACNYDGLTDDQKSELMVMVSRPLGLGTSSICNFPTNGGKSFCESSDPYACPMVCEFVNIAHH